LFVLFIALDNIDVSTLGKDKTPISTNDVETFIKEQLAIEIQRLSTTNIQLVTDKIETKKVKVNLEPDRTRLLKEKNSLVVKREKLRIEIVVINATKSSNPPIRSHQNPFLRLTRDKLKAKRSPPFNNIKENLQKFFIEI